MLDYRRYVLWGIFLLSMIFVSCSSQENEAIPLASFTENDVNVSIHLLHKPDGNDVISATFKPPEGYHLYSKDIPVTGIDGLGRPTLLALTGKSRMQAAAPLIESVKPQTPDFEPKELLVYPVGAVTLSLPVQLPSGDQWENDELSITYMACSSSECKPPVVGKIVKVRIPGEEVSEDP